jgi:hypothetical protein
MEQFLANMGTGGIIGGIAFIVLIFLVIKAMGGKNDGGGSGGGA